jgi:hypothetical protein
VIQRKAIPLGGWLGRVLESGCPPKVITKREEMHENLGEIWSEVPWRSRALARRYTTVAAKAHNYNDDLVQNETNHILSFHCAHSGRPEQDSKPARNGRRENLGRPEGSTKVHRSRSAATGSSWAMKYQISTKSCSACGVNSNARHLPSPARVSLLAISLKALPATLFDRGDGRGIVERNVIGDGV